MLGNTFVGNIDLASVAIWAFWVFFFGLVVYIQRENMREGYPKTGKADVVGGDEGLMPLPAPKTYHLRDGRGDVVVPSTEYELEHSREDLALAPSGAGAGNPWVPTGDPMLDGVGPASWAPRRDVPELDAEGRVKIQPISTLPDFHVSFGRDPRGMVVVGGDGEAVGRVSDIWVDLPEQLIRYLEVSLGAEGEGGTRLVPMNMIRVMSDRVRVRALYKHNWAGIPQIKSPGQVTLLEEDKIMGYVAGGTLYASEKRSGNRLW